MFLLNIRECFKWKVIFHCLYLFTLSVNPLNEVIARFTGIPSGYLKVDLDLETQTKPHVSRQPLHEPYVRTVPILLFFFFGTPFPSFEVVAPMGLNSLTCFENWPKSTPFYYSKKILFINNFLLFISHTKYASQHELYCFFASTMFFSPS